MSKFHFDRKAQKFRTRKSVLLEKMANNAVHTFKVDAFDNRSLNGKTWVPNKVQTGRQQLVKTGRMRTSISIIKRMTNSIIIGSEVPYAKYQNNAKHEFIGNDRVLELKNKKLILAFTSTIA